jgi:nitrogenase delta subunit
MSERAEELVTYIQEHCLWQFFSRSWDRDENIEGILTRAGELLTGEPFVMETQADKCWQAEAGILVAEFKARMPWIAAATREEITGIIAEVKGRMKEITVEKSRNEELRVKNY